MLVGGVVICHEEVLEQLIQLTGGRQGCSCLEQHSLLPAESLPFVVTCFLH